MSDLIYRSPLLYRLAIFFLYRGDYSERYEILDRFIKERSSVVELCCGPGDFYRGFLKKKNVNYLGVDNSADFIKRCKKKGINVIWGEVSQFNFIKSDYYIIISSLYQFHPDIRELINKMLQYAKCVLISEPIKNISNSKYKIISKIAAYLTNKKNYENNFHFTEKSLDTMMLAGFKNKIVYVQTTKNGREKIYVLKNESN